MEGIAVIALGVSATWVGVEALCDCGLRGAAIGLASIVAGVVSGWAMGVWAVGVEGVGFSAAFSFGDGVTLTLCSAPWAESGVDDWGVVGVVFSTEGVAGGLDLVGLDGVTVAVLVTMAVAVGGVGLSFVGFEGVTVAVGVAVSVKGATVALSGLEGLDRGHRAAA